MIVIDTQSFMYQLTINAPLEKGYIHEHIVEIIRSNFKTITFFCMADEEGSMYHTHVFVVFTSRVRFSMVKRYFPEAHIERCRGSVSDNVNYIKKSGKWELDESSRKRRLKARLKNTEHSRPTAKEKEAICRTYIRWFLII